MCPPTRHYTIRTVILSGRISLPKLPSTLVKLEATTSRQIRLIPRYTKKYPPIHLYRYLDLLGSLPNFVSAY